jgi:hypothetical protein
MQDIAQGRAQHHGIGLGDRMGDGDELDLEGARAKLPDIGISVIFASPRRLASASFRRSTAAVKGVA